MDDLQLDKLYQYQKEWHGLSTTLGEVLEKLDRVTKQHNELLKSLAAVAAGEYPMKGGTASAVLKSFLSLRSHVLPVVVPVITEKLRKQQDWTPYELSAAVQQLLGTAHSRRITELIED